MGIKHKYIDDTDSDEETKMKKVKSKLLNMELQSFPSKKSKKEKSISELIKQPVDPRLASKDKSKKSRKSTTDDSETDLSVKKKFKHKLSDSESENSPKKKKRKSDYQVQFANVPCSSTPNVDELEARSKHKKKKKSKSREIEREVEDEEQQPGLEVQDKPEEPETASSDLKFYGGWKKEELLELFNRIESNTPKNDSFRFQSRVEKLDWEKVKFNVYTAEQCKRKWVEVQKNIRKFRLLREMLNDARHWLDVPWSNFYKSGKKNRHPDCPKRALSAYMLFIQDKKDRLRRKHPGISVIEATKLLSEKYRKLTPEKKLKYEKMAEELKLEYNEKKKKFLEEHPQEALKLSKKSALIKKSQPTLSGPKKPVPPFKLYLESYLNQKKSEPDYNEGEAKIECKYKWNHLSIKKKAPWIRWARDGELKYLEELEIYKSENPNFNPPPYKSILLKQEREILDKLAGKPERPPRTAYGLFSSLMLKDKEFTSQFDDPKEKLREIAELWKKVPPIEKAQYDERVKHLQETYKLEYATYLETLPEDRRQEELAKNTTRKKKPVKSSDGKKQETLISILKKKKAKVTNYSELLKKEPVKPVSEPFELFKQNYTKTGEKTAKDAKKAWDKMSYKEHQQYQDAVEELRQKYLFDFKAFLASMSAEELQAFYSFKEKQEKHKGNDDDDDEEEEDTEENDHQADSEEENEVEQANQSSSDDSESDAITRPSLPPIKNATTSSTEDSESDSDSS